jgi:NEDD4-binding protein 2
LKQKPITQTKEKMNTLILMRGVSGSGKSTLAEKICAEQSSAVIVSTDDYFIVEGQYRFDPKKLGEYHAANVNRTETFMVENCPCIIVDNTNTQAWEMKPYVELANAHGYTVQIVEPEPVSFDELMARQAQRADQNKSLPAEVVQRMLSRYENNVTIETILASKRPF